MQSINTIIKFLWIISVLVFLSALFYGYYLLPDVVCIRFSANGSPTEYWERNYVFYVFAGVFALFNILILSMEKFFLLLPDNKKPILNKQFWLQSIENKEMLKLLLSNWFYSFLLILNLNVLLSFGILWIVNYDMQTSILQFNWVPWAIVGSLVVWILYLPLRLSFNKA